MNKVLLVLLLVTAAAGISMAQIAKPLNEDAKSSEKIIQNSPFSAEAVTESVQILWDGTKIVRKMSSKLYRDREGRFRREDSKMQLGVPGQNVEIAESIRIIDPVAGVRYFLDIEDRTYKTQGTARLFELRAESKFNLIKENQWNIKKELNAEKKAEEQAKRNEQQVKRNEQQVKRNEQQDKRDKQKAKPNDDQEKKIEKAAEKAEQVPVYAPGDNRPPVKISSNEDKKGPRSKMESLGVQTIEGVTVEGSRTTTTIAAGTIGNDRDINIVYEKWYSKELQMTVFSKHTDPRFGEQIYRLANISRNNPAISLFTPPADYRDDDDGNDKRVKKPRAGENAKPPVKPAAAGSDIKPGSPPKAPGASKTPAAPDKRPVTNDKKPVI